MWTIVSVKYEKYKNHTCVHNLDDCTVCVKYKNKVRNNYVCI